MIKQHILTPPHGSVLQCLMDAQKRGERIVSVAPHYGPSQRWDDVRPSLGYIVITEDPPKVTKEEPWHPNM